MENNKLLHISVGNSRKDMVWKRTDIMWNELVDKLKMPVRGTESIEEYMKFPKSQQDSLKDVGGFVGGTFKGDRRKANLVEGRDIVTLDMDNMEAGETDAILKRVNGLGCCAAVYSTRKHTSYKPRLRVLVPLDRTVTADEYEPIARKIASLIGIEKCDPTTFEASRLMYWPSCSKDSEYVCVNYDYAFCSADGVLGMYADWQDVVQWPQIPGSEALEKRRLAKQEDPTAKKGVVGAFCRTYTITQAMNKYIPGMYEETDMPGRYTFTGGSTTGGAVIYDGDRFLYSHHATDPCSGLLVNAFDLIRLHMFGDKDADAKEGTPGGKLPSYTAMSQLAKNDAEVSQLMRRERMEQAREVFTADKGAAGQETEEYDISWLSKLTVDASNRYEKTINNVVLILENDPLLKGKIAIDEFACCSVVLGSLPWDTRTEKRRWKDADDAGFYCYIETFYGITGREKLDNALIIVSNNNRINDVKEYLTSLTWDGVKRLDTLLPDYLGAEDNEYTRAVMRKSLCAAVARGIIGGVKFDYMPIFTGPQGIGKSTFLNILGKEWFSDSLTTFEGKEAAELIQGTWINEIGELTAMNRMEHNAVKQFLSKQEDIYRQAYGRRTDKYPRRCVFFGTSNNEEFLKDSTGNRRFWPVDVGRYQAKKSVWEELPKEVDQIWAEAYAYYILGEKLFMPPEIEKMAQEQQEQHAEEYGREGIIKDFLEKKVPINWWRMDPFQRRQYLNGQIVVEEDNLMERDRVCAMEIWVECLNGDPKYAKRTDIMEINGVLKKMKKWEKENTSSRYGRHETQKSFKRIYDKICRQKLTTDTSTKKL